MKLTHFLGTAFVMAAVTNMSASIDPEFKSMDLMTVKRTATSLKRDLEAAKTNTAPALQGQLNQVTGERDQARLDLTQVTGERDKAVLDLNQVTGERDQAKLDLTQVTGERDKAVLDLNQVNAITKALGQSFIIYGTCFLNNDFAPFIRHVENAYAEKLKVCIDKLVAKDADVFITSGATSGQKTRKQFYDALALALNGAGGADKPANNLPATFATYYGSILAEISNAVEVFVGNLSTNNNEIYAGNFGNANQPADKTRDALAEFLAGQVK